MALDSSLNHILTRIASLDMCCRFIRITGVVAHHKIYLSIPLRGNRYLYGKNLSQEHNRYKIIDRSFLSIMREPGVLKFNLALPCSHELDKCRGQGSDHLRNAIFHNNKCCNLSKLTSDFAITFHMKCQFPVYSEAKIILLPRHILWLSSSPILARSSNVSTNITF